MTFLFFQRYSYFMTKTWWTLAVIFMTLEAIDGFFTMWATNHGFVEINKLAEPVASTWFFPAWKIGAAILGIFILMPITRHFPGLVKFGLALVSSFLVVVLVSNILASINH